MRCQVSGIICVTAVILIRSVADTRRRRGGILQDSSVSYRPVMVPSWAALPSDRILYMRPSVVEIPEVIPLNEFGRCCCGAERDTTIPTTQLTCVVYTLTHAVPALVEVVLCHKCSTGRRRYAGPDARELGLFNWNNRCFFTHELLDDYTAAYTSSETPFVAWVNNTSRRYVGRGSPPFVGEEVFRLAWFAYSGLQEFENDMQCPDCGPFPEDVIWDGVTVGFSRKHVLDTMRPPTALHEHSPSYDARYIKHQTLLTEAKLRRWLRDVIEGESLIKWMRGSDSSVLQTPAESDDDEELLNELGGINADPATSSGRKNSEMSKFQMRFDRIPEVHQMLQLLNSGLADFFNTHFGVEAIYAGREPDSVYKKLMRQVSFGSQ